MSERLQFPSEVLEKFILGFPERSLPEELCGYLGAGLGGVILFPRNFSSLEGLVSLTREIRRAAGRPVLIGIDQEGGTRFSLPEPFTQWASPEELGRLGEAILAEQQSRGIAEELRAAGCNLNFAPMLDLHLRPESPVTKGRSFGAEPQKAGELGAAFVRGHEAQGVLTCAKHFPGHGDAVVDPHTDLPEFQGTGKRLQSMELVPFRAAAAASVPLMMTAHISLPKVDREWPASLSETILKRMLRHDLGFRGAVLADDLGMGAIAKRWTTGEAAIRTFVAGSDLALLCHDWSLVRPTLERVSRELAQGSFAAAEWQASRNRIDQLRHRIARRGDSPPLGVVGSAGHKALVREIKARFARGEGRG